MGNIEIRTVGYRYKTKEDGYEIFLTGFIHNIAGDNPLFTLFGSIFPVLGG